MTKLLSEVQTIMRKALGRRNTNDPDSSDELFFDYINNFISLTMASDVRLFEQYGTLQFTIDDTNTTGVYTFNDVGATDDFVTLSHEGYITISTVLEDSISWNRLYIFQDPGLFYAKWGIENSAVLVPGFPTEMLLYGNQMVFRTIPDQSYDVTIYGYKIIPEFSPVGDPELPYDYWLRYLAYGAALDYARDYRYDAESFNLLEKNFAHERKLLLTRTHNQVKLARSMPRF